MKYTVNYFIKKFNAIPEDKWCTNNFENDEGQHCALGHCGAVTSVFETAEGLRLNQIFRDMYGVSAVSINDGIATYKRMGDTPKKRIIYALNAVKKAQK